MIPSVTNGAIIGSAASKKHEKLPRGSLATMIVLPRTTESSRGTSRSCLLMTARMVPIFPGAFQKCMQGTTVQQYLRSFSANTTTQRGSRNKPDRGMPAEPPAAKISVRVRSTFSENRCSPACCRAAHHTYQPWRGGVSQTLLARSYLLNGSLCTWQNEQRGQGGKLPHVSGQPVLEIAGVWPRRPLVVPRWKSEHTPTSSAKKICAPSHHARRQMTG